VVEEPSTSAPAAARAASSFATKAVVPAAFSARALSFGRVLSAICGPPFLRLDDAFFAGTILVLLLATCTLRRSSLSSGSFASFTSSPHPPRHPP
jgi:hypothetical protein